MLQFAEFKFDPQVSLAYIFFRLRGKTLRCVMSPSLLYQKRASSGLSCEEEGGPTCVTRVSLTSLLGLLLRFLVPFYKMDISCINTLYRSARLYGPRL